MNFRLVLAMLASSAWPAMAQEVTVVAPFEIKGNDPTTTGSVFQRMDLVETLINVDGEGQLVPALAEKWSVSEDNLTWHFAIRQGVQFHDGTDLTVKAALGVVKTGLRNVHASSPATTQYPPSLMLPWTWYWE